MVVFKIIYNPTIQTTAQSYLKLILIPESFTNHLGNSVYLTAKEFDLYFLFLPQRREYLRKDNYMKCLGLSQRTRGKQSHIIHTETKKEDRAVPRQSAVHTNCLGCWL